MFAEPWQAEAFALAVKLSEKGLFTWKEWAAALANELNAAASRGEPDDGSHYYDHWLADLEHLVTAKRLADSATLVARKEAWADAYRSTPHGMPVKLTIGSDGRSHKNAMQGTSGSVARCRKSFGSRKYRAEESASQPGNHFFGRGFSLDASIDGGHGRLLRRFPRSLHTHGHPRAATERLIDDAISLSQLMSRACSSGAASSLIRQTLNALPW